MMTPRLTMIASAVPFGGQRSRQDRLSGLHASCAAAHEVDHQDREQADADRAPQDVDRQPVAEVELAQSARSRRLGRVIGRPCGAGSLELTRSATRHV